MMLQEIGAGFRGEVAGEEIVASFEFLVLKGAAYAPFFFP
jgi:hypothetical protein